MALPSSASPGNLFIWFSMSYPVTSNQWNIMPFLFTNTLLVQSKKINTSLWFRGALGNIKPLEPTNPTDSLWLFSWHVTQNYKFHKTHFRSRFPLGWGAILGLQWLQFFLFISSIFCCWCSYSCHPPTSLFHWSFLLCLYSGRLLLHSWLQLKSAQGLWSTVCNRIALLHGDTLLSPSEKYGGLSYHCFPSYFPGKRYH